MADKLLRSIKFPTLPDRYVIGDSTLTEEGAAAEAKAVGDALATKADTKGTYEYLIVGGAEQLMSDEYETDKEPYLFRTTGGSADVGNREYVDKIVGGTVGWNQLVENGDFATTAGWQKSDANDTLTIADNVATLTLGSVPTNYYGHNIGNTLVRGVVGHKYLAACDVMASKTGTLSLGATNSAPASSIFKSVTANTWTRVANVLNLTGSFNSFQVALGNTYAEYGIGDTIKVRNANAFDLTALFNPTVADYIYSLEQSQAGAGVAWFRNYFPKDYYSYDAGTLKSVQTSAHKTYDADGNVIETYPLDSSLTLRGTPKLVDGKLAFDGDVYLPSGVVQRRYGLRAYQSGDESLTDAITDGANTVYKLATPTTETAEGYEQYQICDQRGTEEFVTDSIVPVGHETRYPHDLKKKIETAPDSPSSDGTYLMKRSGGKNTYMALPSTPSANGSYVLTVTVSGGSASYSWTAKE